MKAILTVIILAVISSPLVAAVVAVLRAPTATIDRAVTMIASGLFLLLAGGAAAIVIYASSHWRAAQHAKPSHQVDARRQNIDARKQVMLVNSSGEPMDLPAGSRLVEVMQ